MANNQFEKHPTAQVHPDALIGEGTQIGAFSIVDAKVKIGKNCQIHDHVIIRDYTSLGDDVSIFPFAVIGSAPQHLKYKGEPTSVEIGNRVTLRENVTVHKGTTIGISKTIIGDDAYIMAYGHIAHDCIIGKQVIIANATQLAGHVEIGDHAVLSGLSGITQFCRVGPHCFIGGASMLRRDLPPFLTGKGNDFRVQSVNSVGLSRRGFSPEAVAQIKKMFKIFYRRGHTVSQAIERITMDIENIPERKTFLDFIETSKMGIIR
jgi:UDP-N-acetylglucosamine acyltransferase